MTTTLSDPRAEGDRTTGSNREALLRQAFAHWDERAWENLAETHPDTADAIAALVDQGLVEPDDLRRYAEEYGYLAETGSWLARAAAHLLRRRAVEQPTPAAPPGDSVE